MKNVVSAKEVNAAALLDWLSKSSILYFIMHFLKTLFTEVCIFFSVLMFKLLTEDIWAAE